jgi:hypothetical protein
MQRQLRLRKGREETFSKWSSVGNFMTKVLLVNPVLL